MGVAIIVPDAPRTLVIRLPNSNGVVQETAITKLAGFLFVHNNTACSLTPLAAQPDVTVGSSTGWVQWVDGNFCLCLATASVETSKERKVVRSTAAPTVDALLGAIATAPGKTAAQQATHLVACFPEKVSEIATVLQTWRAGAARTVPMARFLKTLDTQPVVARRHVLVGAYLVSRRSVYQTDSMLPTSVGGVTVGVCVRADKQRINVSRNGDVTTYAPVKIKEHGGIAIVRNDAIVQEHAVRQQHRAASRPRPFPLPKTEVAVRDLLYGVRPEHIPAALSVFARYAEKNTATFGSYVGVRSNEVALVRRLIQMELNVTTFSTRARRVMLAAARGHDLGKMLRVAQIKPRTAFKDVYGFQAGVPFRAPRTKRLLRKKSVWAADAAIRAREFEKPPEKRKHEEPYAMVGRPNGLWHNDADLAAWQRGSGKLAPFELVWEPKLDGWRLVLHWDGAALHWLSNTGRALFTAGAGVGASWIPGDFNMLLTRACKGVRPFVVDCELTEGVLETVTVPELQAYSPDATVTVRSRASAVRTQGADHTLFVIDAVVIDGNDVSAQALHERRILCLYLAKMLAQKLPAHARLSVETVPQYGLTTGTHEIPPDFLREAFTAMCIHHMEGIVIKLTALTYGSPHTVLKPIYYGTQYDTFPVPLPLDTFLAQYQCYACVVYMGYRAVAREPWVEPIFGVCDDSAYPPKHPWHKYTPIHIEGFKTAYSMSRAARVNSLLHVPATGTAAIPFTDTPRATYYLHRVGMFSPKFYMVAEAAYKRKVEGGWKYPFRLYLPRLLAQAPPTLDNTTDLTRRLRPWVLPQVAMGTGTFEGNA